MLYLAVALMVYGWTALDVIQGAPPLTFREAIGAALMCALVAAVWPPVLLWRALLGPAPTC